ncbi:XRE family transcriptional regulator [Pusillimonas sp.]|uniref:helix-turn-helix domain-containing protein n=1 Tax=Pusillimonas sp. TaxID=3040095 RepID=UPI0029A916F2|nr:XRE family transcriptional regulator [Pusillimonas sp.]MDX3895171.1 XRE family transcriptional regulator [Pusillimonas sp.]
MDNPSVNEPIEQAQADASSRLPNELGRRLREHRLAQGLTLEGLAAKVGFDKGYLSRIENGKKVPPIATLARLATALDTDISSFLSPAARAMRKGVSVVRHSEKRPTVLGGSAFGYDYFALSDATEAHAVQPFLFSFPAEVDKFTFFQHDGEEFLYVLTGRIEWQVGMEKYVLEAGDAIHFDSRMPHRGHSLSGEATALVVMYSPESSRDNLA